MQEFLDQNQISVNPTLKRKEGLMLVYMDDMEYMYLRWK